MKRILIVVAVALVALVVFGAGFAFAQYQPVSAAGYGPGMMGFQYPQTGSLVPYGQGHHGMMDGRGGRGVMRDYVEQALAGKLGLTEAKVEEQLAAGKSMAQIALDNGVAEADLQAVLTEVHKTAFDKAVAAGVLTQEQADLVLKNMQTRWTDGMPCLDGGQPGQGFGPGMMKGGRGGRGQWNQAPQAKP
ncbi:MAG: hypothetical protein EHM81_02020 [Chloroflexi bacterium]|nr:MAG: hypothetical protein EHM81_02020 [Chloroflexota bacterium]